jgi:hypothetical protein
MHLTLARLTVTTDLAGSWVEYLSVPDRGMAGDGLGAGVAGVTGIMAAAAGVMGTATTVDEATTVDTATTVDMEWRVVRRAGTTVQ